MERDITGRRIGTISTRMSARRSVHALVLLLGVVAALLVPARVDAAVILEVSGGILTGAKGVEFEGKLYDVTFVTGTCIEVFDGCDSSSDFAFSDVPWDTGRAAAAALLEQVLVDTPLGEFDTQPDLVYGCEAGARDCWFYIPDFQPDSADEVVMGGVALNGKPSSHPDVTGIFTEHRPDILLWAKFTPSSTSDVPEPASLLLLGSGLLGAVATRRARVRK